MADCREHRAAVKFCFLLGKSAAKTIVMLKTAYGDTALSKTRVYEWFSRFKNGEVSIEDQPRSGRPATSRSDENFDKINALIGEDRRRTIDQLCEMSGISWCSIQRIVSDLWRAGDWFFHHDNAPAHTALSVMQFLTKNANDTNFPPPPPPTLTEPGPL